MLDWLTDRILDALADGERVPPPALLFLLRQLAAEAAADIAEPLGAALARELDLQAHDRCGGNSADWLAVFSEAASISDDPRLTRAAADLLTGVRLSWAQPSGGPIRLEPDLSQLLNPDSTESWGPPSGGPFRMKPDPTVDNVMHSIEACLVSINIPEARDLAAEAIDALERVVADSYRPGLGMAHRRGGSPFVRGGLGDQVWSASTLLTAYMLTARLPYAMLADELMQRVIHSPVEEGDDPFALTCDVARVFCRLAALHHDDEYRRGAVLAVDTDYVQEARRTLDRLEPSVRERGVDAAPFGLALAEWLKVQ